MNLGDGTDPSSLTSIHALIGVAAPARVDVRKGAQWRTSGRLIIGQDGDGLLRVESGGFVASGETHLSDGSDSGDAFVTGSGARWQTGNMSLGNFGDFAAVKTAHRWSAR